MDGTADRLQPPAADHTGLAATVRVLRLTGDASQHIAAPCPCTLAIANARPSIRVLTTAGSARHIARQLLQSSADLLVHTLEHPPAPSLRLIRCVRSIAPDTLLAAVAIEDDNTLESLARQAGAHLFLALPGDLPVLTAALDALPLPRAHSNTPSQTNEPAQTHASAKRFDFHHSSPAQPPTVPTAIPDPQRLRARSR